MSYCHICKTECADITRHLFSCHTRPEVVNPGIAAGGNASSNEFEPGQVEYTETFCLQCSREFHTVAALASHSRDTQVHNRSTEYRPRVHSGTPGYPFHNATGSHTLHQRSSISSDNIDYDYEDSVSGSEDGASSQGFSNTLLDSPTNEFHQEYTRDDRRSLYNTDSIHQSPEFSSEEFDSESDEDNDVPMDTEHYNTENGSSTIPIPSVSRRAQYSQPPGSVTGDAQSPNPAYTPGAYAFTSSQSSAHPPGVNAYAQEGMSQGQQVAPMTFTRKAHPAHHTLLNPTTRLEAVGLYVQFVWTPLRISPVHYRALYAIVPSVGGALILSILSFESMLRVILLLIYCQLSWITTFFVTHELDVLYLVIYGCSIPSIPRDPKKSRDMSSCAE
ncbi:hypothetical protein OPQ81_005737 [Rhizoctonia solani]|nr:hypothetical protein OPQ81_005737 [Rhizoctonia solani]